MSVHYAIGLDIGGTKISGAVVSSQLSGECLGPNILKVPTPDRADLFLETLIQMVEKLIQEHRSKNSEQAIEALGISTAGTVDSRTGRVLGSTANLPFLMEISNLGERLEKDLGERFQFPVFVENDANAAAYAEYKVGAGQGQNPMMMVTLGTGVGGGLIVDGNIYSGHGFFAMEVGHICIEKSRGNQKRQCTCGRWGCWEAFASGNGLRQTLHSVLNHLKNAEDSQLLALGQPIESLGNHDLITAWKNGDETARYIMDRWHEDIATGLGSVMNVLNPALVVVGGGLSQFVCFETLTQLTQDRCMVEHISIVPATLGNEAGIVGAAHLALKQIENRNGLK